MILMCLSNKVKQIDIKRDRNIINRPQSLQKTKSTLKSQKQNQNHNSLQYQMAEYRKYIQNVIQSPNSNSDSQRSARNTASNKLSRSKDKLRLHTVKSKQTFLTDTQTSDYTKSSNQCGPSTNVETINETIKYLRKENHELKQQIVQLKNSYYFSINEDKLKELIAQNDRLKAEVSTLKKMLDQSIMERDYLDKLNKNLKNQYSQATLQKLVLNKQLSPKIENQRSPRNTNKITDFQDQNAKKIQRFSVKYLEQIYKPKNTPRNQDSQEKLHYKPRQSTKSRHKQHQKIVKKSRSTSRVMQNEYFVGKGLREDPKKYKKTKKPQDQ